MPNGICISITRRPHMKTRSIHCCGCNKPTNARLTNGTEVYPKRPDLAHLNIWKCDTCGNYVGCHDKSNKPTEPLGSIPTPAIRSARSTVHSFLDPMWKQQRLIKRKDLYVVLSRVMGVKDYHTANINSVEEAWQVIDVLKKIKSRLIASKKC